MSGVDTALWDIVGQAQAKPLAQVWGQRHQSVTAYASTLFPEEPDAAAARTRELARQGFTAVKFGWGSFGTDRQHDLQLLDAISHAAGDEVAIMVDAGRCWPIGQALDRAAELFDRFNLTWLEDPLPEDDMDDYHRLTQHVAGKIAAGEMAATTRPFQALLDQGVKVVQPDVGRAGGLTVCREISTMASRAGAWCVPHCFGTGINFLASLQWMGSSPNAPFIEYPITDSPLRTQLVRSWPALEDGRVAVPTAPGLGVELDEEVIDRYRVA